ncbi:hypothetical protein ACVWZP_002490 [Pseudomonas sp. TE36184]|jgi:hypothetical protein|nr:hypothetical protein C8K66_102191 [Pseudomonas sp. GV105]SEC08792.1 hypothetical protein SAMN04490199_3845 [Pseudomonas marginalis]
MRHAVICLWLMFALPALTNEADRLTLAGHS